MLRRLALLLAWSALAVVVLFGIAIAAGLLWGEQDLEADEREPTSQVVTASASSTTTVPSEPAVSKCDSAIAVGTAAASQFGAAASELLPRIDAFRASEGEVAQRRAELLVLVEDTWTELAESARSLDNSHAQMVNVCASVPHSLMEARREHLEARRKLVATCLASKQSDGVDLDLSWLTGDHDCTWIPLPTA